MIDKILVQIPVTSMFSVVFTLIKALYNKEAVTLTVRTLTTVDVGLVNVPYEDKKDVTIKI